MTSKAVKRARKRNRISLPHGEVAVAPQRQGKRTDIAPDAHKETLSTRARQCGKPDTPEGRKAVSGPEYGCAVGRAIMDNGERDERADLWQAVKHMREVYAAHRSALGAPSPFPKCPAILTPPPAMSADAASPALDTRTDEEKVRHATRAYMAVQGWLGYTDSHARSHTVQAVVYDPDAPVKDWPAVRRALQCVVDGIKGRALQPRFATTT